jgi:hypothetical protein
MPKTVIEKVIIGVLCILIGAGGVSLGTNAFNAASKYDLEIAIEGQEEFTKTEISGAMKVHEEKETIKYETLEVSVKKLLKWQEFTYLRELEKYDKALYLIELKKINAEKHRQLIGN